MATFSNANYTPAMWAAMDECVEPCEMTPLRRHVWTRWEYCFFTGDPDVLVLGVRPAHIVTTVSQPRSPRVQLFTTRPVVTDATAYQYHEEIFDAEGVVREYTSALTTVSGPGVVQSFTQMDKLMRVSVSKGRLLAMCDDTDCFKVGRWKSAYSAVFADFVTASGTRGNIHAGPHLRRDIRLVAEDHYEYRLTSAFQEHAANYRDRYESLFIAPDGELTFSGGYNALRTMYRALAADLQACMCSEGVMALMAADIMGNADSVPRAKVP